jgi:hypothetical protein
MVKSGEQAALLSAEEAAAGSVDSSVPATAAD